MCGMHYQRAWKHGDPLGGKWNGSNGGRCAVDQCSRTPRSGSSSLCEMHYYRIRRTGSVGVAESLIPPQPDACLYCEQPISSGGRYCSDRCRSRAARGNERYAQCPICGRMFEPRERNITCSPSCRHNLDLALHRHNYQRHRYRRIELMDRRKRLVKCTQVEIIDRVLVYEGDNWTCQLCGEFVDKQHRWPHPLCGSLDHIIPLSRGGTHERKNVQLAHFICNSRKSDTGAAQLRLLG